MTGLPIQVIAWGTTHSIGPSARQCPEGEARFHSNFALWNLTRLTGDGKDHEI